MASELEKTHNIITCEASLVSIEGALWDKAVDCAFKRTDT
jgi:hypothetical protein